MNEKMTIGLVAKASGVGVETVRFYERKGLIKQPRKTGSFRYYSDDHILRIKFLKRSQEIGFTLKEAKDLLDLKIKNQSKCSDVLAKTKLKIDEINKKISDLNKMKKSLKSLEKCCVSEDMPLSDCPILDCFMENK